jgi:hypothetical protein
MIRSLFFATACSLAALQVNAAIFMGVTSDNRLVSFNTAAPATFITDYAITGLKMNDGVTADPGATLLNLTYHATSDLHYGIDSNANFYSVSRNGVATIIDNTFIPTGFSAGFAYDPFSDKMLFASDTAENVLFATNGTRTTNPALVFGAGDVNFGAAPKVFGAGIDPDFGNAFFVDADLDILVKSIDPNFSELFTVGSLGVNVVSFGGLVVDADGTLWGALSTDALVSSLFEFNTATGQVTLVDGFGTEVSILSIAAIPEPSRALLLGIAGIGLVFRRRRSA